MSAQNDGGPAFPTQHVANGNTVKGMTLRDWFAGQALAGDMASQDGSGDGIWPNDASHEDLTKRATLFYRMADAMLAARQQPDGMEGKS